MTINTFFVPLIWGVFKVTDDQQAVPGAVILSAWGWYAAGCVVEVRKINWDIKSLASEPSTVAIFPQSDSPWISLCAVYYSKWLNSLCQLTEWGLKGTWLIQVLLQPSEFRSTRPALRIWHRSTTKRSWGRKDVRGIPFIKIQKSEQWRNLSLEG